MHPPARTAHLGLAPALTDAGPGPPSPTLELERLADVELGLLAQAVGDHLAPELADRVLRVRARRAQLLGHPEW